MIINLHDRGAKRSGLEQTSAIAREIHRRQYWISPDVRHAVQQCGARWRDRGCFT